MLEPFHKAFAYSVKDQNNAVIIPVRFTYSYIWGELYMLEHVLPYTHIFLDYPQLLYIIQRNCCSAIFLQE